MLDTGASCSIIKASIARRLECHLCPNSMYIQGIGDGNLYAFAKILVPIQFDDVCLELDLYVVEDFNFPCDCIIGKNAIQLPDIAIVSDSKGSRLIRTPLPPSVTHHVNMIQCASTENDFANLTNSIKNLDPSLQQNIMSIFKKYPSVLPSQNVTSTVTTGQLKIRLTDNKVICYRPYRLAPIEREKITETVKELIECGIIRESDSDFASPVLLVKKKDGSDRMCIDYRALNKIIEKDRYPLPLIEDQIDRLGNADYYISIDMKNGFYQIPVSPESIKYTAFVTPDGHFEFLKMPFGICNGPSVFQRAICKAVQHLKFLLVYVDDLLIPFSTVSEGLEYLEQTLQALSTAGFTLNLKKCKFFETSIEYLGRIISKDGVGPSDTKVSALIHSPVPTSVKQVKQFMGLASYFRRFIPEFATRTACITKLTKTNQKWEWGWEQDEARDYIIKLLISKPLLTIFNPKLPTELHTDASALGYGAILLQRVNDVNRVVAYFSKRTSPPESRYHSYELETLSIYNALKHFRVYLLGIHFKIITDCNAIKSTANKKDLSPRVARWWTYMQDFNFDVVYRKGKYVGHVDYLSRNPEVPPESRTEFVNVINAPRSWLQIAQRRDSETQSLIERVQSGEVDANQYLLKNDLLYYKSGNTGKPKLYVPKGSRLSILRLFHDENCHVGIDKTLNKISENFWFPGITKFVKKYISHCLVCTTQKSHHGPKQGLLHPIEKTPIPFHTLHLDCTGPFTQARQGYKYILLIIDAFTKFCLLKPLKTMAAQELVDTVRDSVTLFGTPSLIITDRGSNFSSKQLQALFTEWQVEHHMIATGTPRGNGQVERYVTTVTNMLSTMCSPESDWPSELWRVQQSINTTVQKSTGFTPMRLLIGRDSNIPCIQARLDELAHNDECNQLDVRSDRQLAQQRLKDEADKFKRRFDSTRRDNITYKIGDFVYVNQDHRRNDKLKEKFKGPYEILDILENDRYHLKGPGNLRNVTIAKDKLRLWPGEWVDQNVSLENYLLEDNSTIVNTETISVNTTNDSDSNKNVSEN